jgi:hypothetical protein
MRALNSPADDARVLFRGWTADRWGSSSERVMLRRLRSTPSPDEETAMSCMVLLREELSDTVELLLSADSFSEVRAISTFTIKSHYLEDF